MADSRPALEVASEYGVMLLCGPDYENKGKIISHGRHLERDRQKVVGGGWGVGGATWPRKNSVMQKRLYLSMMKCIGKKNQDNLCYTHL